MGVFDKFLGEGIVQAGQADIEAGLEGEAIGIREESHRDIDGDIIRKAYFLFAGGVFNAAEKTSGPTGGEQLLGVGAGAGAIGDGERDVQAAIGGAGGTAIAAADGVGLGGVEEEQVLGFGVGGMAG